MKLLIDIGNTSAKLVVMDDDILYYERRHESWRDTFSRLMSQYLISDVRLSSVAGEDAELNEVLLHLDMPVRWLTAAVPCPIKPIANVPSGLGADRWAADIGAIAQDPEHSLLIIDAGTCLTYDVIAHESYMGGAISPGVQLRLNAMHEHTALLPQIEAEQEAVLLGYDTRTHMLSAAVNGTRFEIEGYIRQLLGLYPDLHVFITGGNTFHFADDITCPITHDPYLVFRGLGCIS